MDATLEASTVDAIRDAFASLGLAVSVAHSGGPDIVLTNPAGGQILIEVKRLALASGDGLARQLARWKTQDDGVGIVVADRVTAEARDLLRDAGWGWLDLRGHLHLATNGFFVDASVGPLRGMASRSAPLAGRVALEVACLVLLDPGHPVVVRRTAATLGRAPSSVSQAVSALASAGLLDANRRPALPELFWELASHWRSPHVDLHSLPSPGTDPVNQALRLGLSPEIDTVGWALTDTLAAAAYGAPISVRSDAPPDFYVPDEATLRRAVTLLGAAPHNAERAARVRVAPVPMVCSDRVDLMTESWPVARPLFVALDLAQDPGRGREILANWTPFGPELRVW